MDAGWSAGAVDPGFAGRHATFRVELVFACLKLDLASLRTLRMAELKFLNGGSDMATLIRAHDWTDTSLGDPSTWSQSLRTLVGVALSAKQPMFVAWGPDLAMIYNDAYVALLGAKHPGALGRPFETVWQEAWADLRPLVDQVLAGDPVHMDDITLFVNRDGRDAEAHFAFSYTPVFGDGGSVAGLFCPCAETTEQMLAERDLAAARDLAEEANVAKSTFIANMSHELRTPLSAIIGYSEMLIEDLSEGGDPEALVGDMRKIETNARHLLGLINDVLDLSKIESGKMEVFAEAFDTADVVREVAGTVRSLVDKKGNSLTLDVGDALGSMHTDVTKLRQILLNLLSNAAKFTEGGTITLTATRIGGAGPEAWLAFRVSDTGLGMSEQQLGRLFLRFSQADASTTRKFGGTGLGLSLTKAFSLMLGGDIAVESAPGLGSTFTVMLPATLSEQAEEAAVGSARDGAFAGSPGAAGKTDWVLVIDDDPAQRDLMSRFLAREGFGARTAPDGPSGIALARTLKPKAILLDVMMPGMDGWSVLSALKADPELDRIPVVMVTFASERSLATSLGAADYVAKPVKWDRFKQVMDRFRDAVGDVLVIDDSPDTRERLRRALERDGWTVAQASNGREALDRIGQALPRVILLDLTMPIMDGFAFLQALRERPDCRDLPVIVLSSLDLTREDRRRLRGANQILDKGTTSLPELARDLHALTDAKLPAGS